MEDSNKEKDHFPEAGSEPVVLTETRLQEIRNSSNADLLTQRTSLKSLSLLGPELSADLAAIEHELYDVRGVTRPEDV